MPRTVDFYFDYLSPYAYLAWLCLPEITDPRGVEIVPRPVLFAGLLNHWGQLGPAEIPPKAAHVSRDIRRFAGLRGLPLQSPRYHPFNPLPALRVSLAGVSGDNQKSAISAIFGAGWAEGCDLGDPADICAALNTAGLQGEALVAQTRNPGVKEQLRADTERAIDLGVFGIPTMVVDGELFWGLDQLHFLELYLDGDDPLKSATPGGLGSHGRAVVRPGSVGRGQGNDGKVVKIRE
jgi:2-hydroxychromene-2-carboxylate isomerase